MSDKAELLQLLKGGEHIRLECKEASNKIPKEIWETYSAFANTYGGIILLGVKENTKETRLENRYVFSGTKNPSQRMKEFWDTLYSDKVSSNILLEQDVRKLDVDGKSIILIKIPQADYRRKPIYINGNPIKGTYKRNHEGDYHCSEEEVKGMIRDSSDTGTDNLFLEDYTMEDIDLVSLQGYRNEFQQRNPDHIWNSCDNKEFLRNLGGYIKNRKSQKEGLTAAGLLMFGKGSSIRERFDNFSMDFLDYSNLEDGQRYSDRLSMDGMWENNLYTFVRKVLPKLTADLKKPFQIEGMVRIDETLVHISVREALINMIIHADYRSMGNLKVIKYEDGFTFSNPGNLKIPVSAIFEGNHTVARNPKIQTMFRMIGLCENIGSGFPTILNAWKKQNWREPDLYDNLDLKIVELKLWMHSDINSKISLELERKFGSLFYDLSNQEQRIMETAFLESGVSTTRLMSLLKIDLEDIQKILNNLVDKKILIAIREKNKITYNLNNEFKNITFMQSMNETDRLILKLLQQRNQITNKMIIESIDTITSIQGASKAINRLIELGYVQKEKKGNTNIYSLI